MIGRHLDRLYPERIATATDRVALKVTRFRQRQPARRRQLLDLREGEVLGVGGLQGHGQRELFQALFGVAKATGSLELWGKPRRSAARAPRSPAATASRWSRRIAAARACCSPRACART